MGAAVVGHLDIEGETAVVDADVLGAVGGLCADAVGDDATVLYAADWLLHRRVVDEEHGEAVAGDVLDKGLEAAGERFLAAAELHDLGVVVGNPRVGGRQRSASRRTG